MAIFNSDRLIEALKRKRFATGKLAETLEIPVDVLHKIIATSEGDDLIVSKLNALLDEADVANIEPPSLTAEKWTQSEAAFSEDWSRKILDEAFIILTPVQRLKQAVEEGKLTKDQILAAENKSPVPRTTVIEWTQTISKTEG